MEIIAHRGASGLAPENTLSAFKKALEMGSQSVEFDVQMTSDGKLIVLHDDLLGRTIEGNGLVIQNTAEHIRSLSAGKWFGNEYEDERVPFLEEVLELYGNNNTIHLEIKKLFIDKRNIEDKIIDEVKNMGLIDNVLISSFNHRSLKYISDNYDLPLGLLIGSGMLDAPAYAVDRGIRLNSINPSGDYVDEDMIRSAHEAGHKVYVYTINDKNIAGIFNKFGVDGIYSNYPNILDF